MGFVVREVAEADNITMFKKGLVKFMEDKSVESY